MRSVTTAALALARARPLPSPIQTTALRAVSFNTELKTDNRPSSQAQSVACGLAPRRWPDGTWCLCVRTTWVTVLLVTTWNV